MPRLQDHSIWSEAKGSSVRQNLLVCSVQCQKEGKLARKAPILKETATQPRSSPFCPSCSLWGTRLLSRRFLTSLAALHDDSVKYIYSPTLPHSIWMKQAGNDLLLCLLQGQGRTGNEACRQVQHPFLCVEVRVSSFCDNAIVFEYSPWVLSCALPHNKPSHKNCIKPVYIVRWLACCAVFMPVKANEEADLKNSRQTVPGALPIQAPGDFQCHATWTCPFDCQIMQYPPVSAVFLIKLVTRLILLLCWVLLWSMAKPFVKRSMVLASPKPV